MQNKIRSREWKRQVDKVQTQGDRPNYMSSGYSKELNWKGKGKKKRARPSSSTSDEYEEGGRHYEELDLCKTLKQKDADKSVAIAAIAGLQATKDEIKVLNDKVVALETSLQFTQVEHDEVKEPVATCENEQIKQESELTRPTSIAEDGFWARAAIIL